MSATLLDGDSLAKRLINQLAPRIAAVTGERGAAPLLSIISIGDDGASALYMRKKLDACREAGIETSVQVLPASATESEVHKLIAELAQESGVDAIIVDAPLPKQLSLPRILEKVPVAKDVEAVSPRSFGRLFEAKSLAQLEAVDALLPPTPHAVLQLLAASQTTDRQAPIDAASTAKLLAKCDGMDAVVVGRSSIVGRPVAHLLSCVNATVTLCHSRTRDLRTHLKRADIVVSAVGKTKFIKGADLKPGCIALDAGIGYEGGKVVGDIELDSAKDVASAISPVPGGVGPVTVAMLLANIVATAERRMRSGDA
ncbi:MAG: bifunctional 5,10-methylenetetrahydrofolate dehydrogenase/5,10-methenyltetrahydrofolate cyclohydrolase [Elusimicrobia bacterium]|nr:bifunctional 5,10-methylenetetrahydrofolate dehydrogenase/5,10-methenyltetrahydrofolate cyclohydrolase [Elusimicrobiota bacterium]